MQKVAIVFALFSEFLPCASSLGVPFLKRMRSQIILDDRNVALVRSGIGKEKAMKATEMIILKFKPKVIISAGFCGALVEDLKVGDIVVSDFNDGKIFCSDRTLFTYDEKISARCQHNNAVIVDMESEAVYSAAKRYGIPFVAIKAVSDGLRDDIAKPLFELPSFVKLFRLKRNVDIASKRLSEFLLTYVKEN